MNILKVFEIFFNNLPAYADGVVTTLLLALITIVFSTIIGTFIAILRKVKFIGHFFRFWISFVRGTPLLVQVLLFVYGLPPLGIRIPRIIMCTIALINYSSAYVSEIVRSGVQSVNKNQIDAAESLGFNPFQVLVKIIFPQAIKHTIPALGNEFIVIIKQSSVLYAVGVYELTYQANKIASQNLLYIETMISAALIYYLITLVLTKVLSVVEGRLFRSER